MSRFLAVFICAFAIPAVGQTVFVVNSTADPGSDFACDATECTFAEAIGASNRLAGVDTLVFDIQGDGPHTIQTSTFFPPVTDEVVIDGFSQPGAVPHSNGEPAILKIELDGSNAAGDAHGLIIETNRVIVRGLVINRFPRGGVFIYGNQNEILGCHIGTDVTGAQALGNGFNSDGDELYDGVWVQNGIGNRIGGFDETEQNVISGNAYAGVYVDSPGGVNLVAGNFVGLDAGGTSPIPNVFGVVFQNSPNNFASFNVVSGNDQFGFIVLDVPEVSTLATGNRLAGNYVGTDHLGDNAVANGSGGILLNASRTVIGGPGSEGNLVSGNNGDGIVLADASGPNNTRHNSILGNKIGTNAAGDAAIPNSFGVVVLADSNSVGSPTQGNLISGNSRAGVLIAQGDGDPVGWNTVQANLIGTQLDGRSPLGNGEDGVIIIESPANQVGGGGTGEGNVLASNGFAGVYVREAGSDGNMIWGNFIGTNTHEDNLGNQDSGVDILMAQNTSIGGDDALLSNVIANNARAGVNVTNERPAGPGKRNLDERPVLSEVKVRGGSFFTVVSANALPSRSKVAAAGQGNSIVMNSIRNNGGLGIDLGQNLSTANDPDDPDDGPNRLQNWPEVSEATYDGTTLTVKYKLTTAVANAAYPVKIHFYFADPADGGSVPPDNGEGHTFIGSEELDGGKANTEIEFLFTPENQPEDDARLVATATDSDGNTSEFSHPVELTGTGVAVEEGGDLPGGFTLSQNYPNPFNPDEVGTTISYELPKTVDVRLVIFDGLGRVVESLVNGQQSAGRYSVTWDAERSPSGVYFYRLELDSGILSRKMIVTK